MDLRVAPWREAINGIEIESYHDFASAFDSLAERRKEAGAEDEHHSLKLLAALCTMYIKTESLADPFGPMLSGPNGRTMIPDDLSEEELQALEVLLPEIDNHWLKARVADTLWVRQRRRKELALMAMESYVFISDTEIRHSFEAVELKRRALLIARAFDRTAWRRMIDELVARFLEDSTDNVTDKLDLFQLFSGYLEVVEQREEVLDLLIVLGDRALDSKDFILARECWKSIREQYRGQQQHAKENQLTHRIADSFLQEEELQSTQCDKAMVSDYLVRAALAEYTGLPRSYRREHNIEGRIADLRKDLGTIGIEVIRSMGTISSEPMDIAEMVRTTESRIQGQSLDPALFEYARMCYRTNVDATREFAEELVQKHPLRHIMGGMSYSADGRVVAKRDGLNVNDPESYVRAIETETVRHFGLTLGISASGCIVPGLEVLQKEHNISLDFCRRLMSRAALVPHGRTESWAKGMYLGFKGEICEATHILVPQIEHWLRWLLQASGDDTIRRQQDRTDIQLSMETMLSDPMMKEMLNDGLWFELNYYFLSPHGAKLRNNLMHGLIADDEMRTSLFYSFWHMCLRLGVLSLPILEEPSDA
ncbi:MAG: DUF4209 domain-containing protein [Chlorobi bacterium]|nr:MAG: DUF4209 domain-containing protein [Bacteroidota bacterium]KXK34645.1 MAG: hypothetical protein UZ06_CHB003001108 [Chlorobi bacterium OLB6]MBL1160947.1 DUF4209 domain-containing protein [Chlorobiota bacterium]MBW7852906.1 DUF4209 domain-containing protein [Candidatus Kapabacteria bacterium]MCC6330864.1 DUF4209 domain-containing protein [Ignavibacteria bacterium]